MNTTTTELVTTGKLFDADNHYWETSDAFTRHRDPKFADRGVQVKEIEGVPRYVIDGQIFAALPGPGDVHPRPKPGAFMDYFKGKTTRAVFLESFNVPPSEHPEWYKRDDRLRVMDDQGVDGAWMFRRKESCSKRRCTAISKPPSR